MDFSLYFRSANKDSTMREVIISDMHAWAISTGIDVLCILGNTQNKWTSVGIVMATLGRINIQRIYIQDIYPNGGYMDIYPFIWQAGYFDISRKGSEYRIFLLHKISILATGYRIWIYIHWKSVDLDMILYPKKVDMTQCCIPLLK